MWSHKKKVCFLPLWGVDVDLILLPDCMEFTYNSSFICFSLCISVEIEGHSEWLSCGWSSSLSGAVTGRLLQCSGHPVPSCLLPWACTQTLQHLHCPCNDAKPNYHAISVWQRSRLFRIPWVVFYVPAAFTGNLIKKCFNFVKCSWLCLLFVLLGFALLLANVKSIFSLSSFFAFCNTFVVADKQTGWQSTEAEGTKAERPKSGCWKYLD